MINFKTSNIINKLGAEILYIYASGERKKVKAIFEYEYSESFEHSSQEPYLTFATDTHEPKLSDKALVHGEVFRIVTVEPDGSGAVRCKLVKV